MLRNHEPVIAPDEAVAVAEPDDVTFASTGGRVVPAWEFRTVADTEPAPADVPPPLLSPSASLLVPPPDTIDEAPPAARRSTIRWIAVGLFLVAAGALAARQFASPAAAGSDFTVRQADLRKVVAARGRIEPQAEVAVSAKMIGRVREVMVGEGDRVTAGQRLALMEDSELRAALAQAEARVGAAAARLADLQAGARPQEIAAARAALAEQEAIEREARATLDRFTELAGSGVVSVAQLDEARRRASVAAAQRQAAAEGLGLLEAGPRIEQLRAARAELAQAQSEREHALAELGNAEVLAPASGVVLRRYMEPGEVIVLQRPQPILTIADDARVFVRAEVDETDVPKVAPGQRAIVTAAGYDGQFVGRVVEIGRSAGRKTVVSDNPSEIQDTRVVEVRIELPAETGWTFGATAEVEIIVVDQEEAPVVPVRAIATAPDGDEYVQVRESGSVRRQPVVTGLRDDAFVEVVSGVEPGDVVVVPPLQP